MFDTSCSTGSAPLVSVVIPVYGVERYLDECVSSVVSQTYRNIEVILVDDGSPDDCPAMCDEWARRDGRVRVLHRQNGGLSAARNSGLGVARGEYVLFVDSDDLISPVLAEKAVEHLQQDESEICLYKHVLFEKTPKSTWGYKEAGQFPESGAYDSEAALAFLFSQRIHNYAQMRVASRALYERIGFAFPEGRSMEDMATTAIAIGESERVSIVDEPLYYYRQRPGSIVASWSHKMSANTHLALADMLEYVRGSHPSMLAAAENYAIKMLFYCWKSEPSEDASSVSLGSRREEIAEWIADEVRCVGRTGLSRLNLVKYLLLRVGLLGLASKVYG